MTLPDFLQGFDINDKQSLDCFNELGLPTKKNENWHYLDMQKVMKGKKYTKQSNDNSQADELFDAIKINIVNGNIKLTDNLPSGLDIKIGKGEFSSKLLSEKQHSLLELNNAIDGDVININITDDIDKLIHLDYYNDMQDVALFPKIIVNIADGKKSWFAETFRSPKGVEVFCNSLIEIFVGKNAKLYHYKIQHDMGSGNNVGYVKSYVKEQGFYGQSFACFNNDITRNEVEIDLLGNECEGSVQGIYIGTNERVIDNTIRINHFALNCESNQLFKGILNDKAQGIFQGKIYVDKEAQKTDGYQMHRSILLSDDAQVNGKPELEIYADDVKCSHGSSTGEINPEQKFYLTSRGVDDKLADKLLLQAFLNEVFDYIDNPDVRNYLQETTVSVMEDIL